MSDLSDGKLIFKTKIDNSNIEKELKVLERKIRSSQESISKMNNAKIPWETKSKDLGGQLDAAKRKVEELRKELEKLKETANDPSDPVAYLEAGLKIPDLEQALKENENEVKDLQKQWDKVNDKVDNYDAKIKAAETDIARYTEQSAALQEKMFTPNQVKMSESMAKAEKIAGSFGKRIRSIAASALMFNLISKGLRSMVSYMGQAAMADKNFATALSALKGSILTAFQPIYEVAIPAITTLVNWLNTAVQVIARFFAALTGKSYSQMVKNAKALNKEAGGISNVGDAAEEATNQLMGFDEINRLESLNGSGGGISGGGSSPSFDEIDIPSTWEAVIEGLALKIKDIFFKWDDLTAEDIVQKLVVGLDMLGGALIGFALGGPAGAVIGATVGAGIGLLTTSVLFDGDGNLSSEELLSSLITVLGTVGGGLIGFALGGAAGAAIGATVGAVLGVVLSKITFDGDSELSTEEIIKTLVAALAVLGGGIMGFMMGGPLGAAVGATIGLGLTFSISAMDFDGVKRIVQEILQEIEGYFSTTFSDGFINGLITMVTDGINILWKMFVNFVNDIVNSWNTLWGYQTTGTVSPLGVDSTSAYSMMPETPITRIPALARGAVLPANKPFLAMVGDQKSGTNVEAPLETIKQALAEVLGESGLDVDINFTGSLSQLARVLTPEITKRQRQTDRAKGG